MRKRILHLIDSWGPGGAETIFSSLVTGLDGRWCSFASVPEPGWLSRSLEADGVRPILIPASGRYNIRHLLRLVSVLRDLDIDLVHTHNFGAALYGSLAGSLRGIPVVCTLHGTADLSAADRGWFIRRLVVRLGARRVVFVSRSLRNAFHKRGRFPPERTTVIYNGVDLTRFHAGLDQDLRQSLGLSAHHILVGAVGNFRPHKGFDVFLKAAGCLAQQDGRFRFVIAGEPDGTYFPRVEAMRRELGLQDRLALLGFRPDIERVFRALDIFVCPSSSEGFSLTTVQALASAVPVVATRSGGPEEILEDGQYGLLVDPEAPDQMAEAVLRLTREDGLGQRLKQRGVARAVERFSMTRMLQDYTRLYYEVLR